jgi:hypothetical protein
MGIKGLTKLIADKAPDAIKEGEIGNYFSRCHPTHPTLSSTFEQWEEGVVCRYFFCRCNLALQGMQVEVPTAPAHRRLRDGLCSGVASQTWLQHTLVRT